MQLVARVAAGWVQKPAKAKAAVEDSEFVDETDALISGLEAIQVGNRYALWLLRESLSHRKRFADWLLCVPHGR